MRINYSVDEVVSHRKPMSLLDTIEDYSEHELEARAAITADNAFLTDGYVPAWVGIEYMAQAVAAWAGVGALQRQEGIKVGFLVGTRRYRVNRPGFPVGAVLGIHVRQLLMAENGLGAFECRIVGEDGEGHGIEASASLNVFQPDNVNELLKVGV